MFIKLVLPLAIIASPLTAVPEVTTQIERKESRTRDVVGFFSDQNAKVLMRYDSLTNQFEEYAKQAGPNWDKNLLYQAIEFAALKHDGQVRKSKEKTPYIVHPLAVTEIVWEFGGVRSTNVLVAAILHDTLEDTSATEEEIEVLFGSRVLSTVKELSNDPNLTGQENKLRQIEHAPGMSQDAALIKLSDRLNNIQDITSSPPEKWGEEEVVRYLIWGRKLNAALPGVSEPIQTELTRMIDLGLQKNS